MAGPFGAVVPGIKAVLGLAVITTGLVAALALIAASANPGGLGAVPGLYVSGPIGIVIVAFVVAAILDVGVAMIRGRDLPWAHEGHGSPVLGAIGAFVLGGVAMYLLVNGAAWAIQRIAAGLDPSRDTWIVIGSLALYPVLRVYLTVGHADLGEIARRLRIDPAWWKSEPEESLPRRNVRIVAGFLVLLAVLDSLIDIPIEAIPRALEILPFAPERALVAAALWILGIWGVWTLGIRRMRGRATAGRDRADAAVVLVALVSSLAIAIPLYQLPAPALVSPPPGAVLPQQARIVSGTAQCVPAPWTFTWTGHPAFVRYRLVVRGPAATIPLVDTVTSETSYAQSGCGWIAGSNRAGWHWQVWGITGGGRTSPASELRSFDVAELR